MATGYVWHELYGWHDTNGGASGMAKAGLQAQPFPAPESPETKTRFNSLVHVSGLIDSLEKIAPRYATEEDLLRVHTAEYVRRIRTESDSGGGNGDTIDGTAGFGAGSFEIASLAAGGTIAATEAVLDGRVANVYALVRPPGHHARPEMGMGFCLFANVAVAAEWARATYGIDKIAIFDWDVHHGNGTEACFESDPRTLNISLHQDELFPLDSGHLTDRGVGAGEGTTLNIPLPAGSGNGGYVAAVTDVVVPALRAFDPELIFIASGFDASAMDPLAHQVVTAAGYREMTRLIMEVADEVCDGRLVVSHEGGYSPLAVPYCGLAVLEELSGVKTEIDDPYGDYFGAMPAQTKTEAQAKVIAAAAELAMSLGLVESSRAI